MFNHSPDESRDDFLRPDDVGGLIYLPLAWRSGEPQDLIEESIQELYASYVDLPVPDRLLDLVRRTHG